MGGKRIYVQSFKFFKTYYIKSKEVVKFSKLSRSRQKVFYLNFFKLNFTRQRGTN